MAERLDRGFYCRDVLEVAPGLLGQHVIIHGQDGNRSAYVITETEAYRGTADRACHASKGRTARTDVMFRDGGHLYMYLIYGIHWMMNVVAAGEGVPQAVLIRGVREVGGQGRLAGGPGRVTSLMGMDGSFYGEDLVSSGRIWIERSGTAPEFHAGPRIGIDYAGEPWKSKPWRFLMKV